jgi:hypothetical protein
MDMCEKMATISEVNGDQPPQQVVEFKSFHCLRPGSTTTCSTCQSKCSGCYLILQQQEEQLLLTKQGDISYPTGPPCQLMRASGRGIIRGTIMG